jgi:parvulin-like peptidyl-prolyl isomerase
MKPLLPAVLCLSLAGLTARAAIFERIIAKVNGEIVTLSDFENRQLAAVQAAGVPADKISAFLREHSGRILEDTIDEMLVYQKGEAMGIADRVTSEYLDKVVEDIKKEHKIESDEVFRSQLAREGLTLEALRRNIKRSIVRQQVVRQMIETKISVSEDEVRSEYARRKSEYTKPASVRLQEIVLKPDTPEARALAQDLAKRARTGEDFGALAKQHSTGATRATGGDLGAVALGELHSELRKAIANVEVSGVSEPIVLGGTVRILKVNERQDARTVGLEEAREELSRRLRKDRGEKEMARFVEELRKDSSIERRVRDAPITTDVTVPTSPSLLRDPAVSAPPPEGTTNTGLPAGAGDDELVVSPQERAKKVSPPAAPTPVGTPTPLPGAPGVR